MYVCACMFFLNSLHVYVSGLNVQITQLQLQLHTQAHNK